MRKEWFNMTDEERKHRKKMRDVCRADEYDGQEYIVELFTIDLHKNELTLIKEPCAKNITLTLSETEIEDVMAKYTYFKVDAVDGLVTFGQDLLSESAKGYFLRKEFTKDFGKYYKCDYIEI